MNPKNKIHDIFSTIIAYALLILIVAMFVGYIYMLHATKVPKTSFKFIGVPPFIW
jgi:hypothetical protein